MTENFKNRLRKARDLRGLTQSEMAAKSGLQAAAISHFETGQRSPSFDNLRKLSDALNVSVDYLLGRIDEEQHGQGWEQPHGPSNCFAMLRTSLNRALNSWNRWRRPFGRRKTSEKAASND